MNAKDNVFGDSDPEMEQGVAPQATPFSIHARTDFLPWHKPRKQWIRREQWARSIEQLAETLALADQQEPLRYLSMPGPDLLDIRSIHPICLRKNIKLQFVGLNAGNDDNNKAVTQALLSQVRALPAVHEASEIVEDRLEHLWRRDTVSYKRIIDLERSFDVINMDLCGSFTEGMPSNGDTVPKALSALLEHQANNRTKDWLFFITSKVDSRSVHQATMQRMIDHLNGRFQQDPAFLEAVLDNGLLQPDEVHESMVVLEQLSAQSYACMCTVGIGLWMVELVTGTEPGWKATMLPHYEYRVAPREVCDMVSLGFYCERLRPQAAPNILNNQPVVNPPATDKPALIRRSINKIRERVRDRHDVDLKLHLDPALYAASLDEAAALMVECLYDEAQYREWAEARRIEIEPCLENKIRAIA